MPDVNKQFSPEKAAFMASMLDEIKGKSQNDLLPFLMTVASRGNAAGIQFSDDETNHLISMLTENMGPRERKQVAMIQQISKMIGKRS